MDASVIGALLGGIAAAFAGAAFWTGLRGIGEVFDFATGNKEFGR
ncbi:hypothetical protein ABS767_09550 [Sphingomonas sp. ST-64]|uniref:Uncharacterized protein n=1 Tax=Sphingomonas plantiphila TaxID=3163295 RepID=A0ABW8YLQ5_9SPHN|nr:hypothetical protein [Sphingomonas suaedae]